MKQHWDNPETQRQRSDQGAMSKAKRKHQRGEVGEGEMSSSFRLSDSNYEILYARPYLLYE